MQFGNLGKRSLELAFGAGIQKINLQIEGRAQPPAGPLSGPRQDWG
jgi:hypothetical protein